MVLIPVNVTDHDGKTLTDLQARDFSIFDDRAQQRIASFSSEDAPCSVGVVLDISGSMRVALDATKSIAQAFLKASNPDDEFLMLTVSSLPVDRSKFSSQVEALAQDIQAATPGGMTALLDTVYLGLNRMRTSSRPRKSLLILSDGMDNQSRYTKRELMRLALETDVQVYTILVDGIPGSPGGGAPFVPSMVAKPWQQAAERQGPMTLKELSEKTGGLYSHIRNSSEGAEVAASFARALRSEYVIGYRAPHSGESGKWHQVQVRSTVPKSRIYARSGYYAQ
jgi:Ca-activated chloride channel family protein